jgi:hypothetical protein
MGVMACEGADRRPWIGDPATAPTPVTNHAHLAQAAVAIVEEGNVGPAGFGVKRGGDIALPALRHAHPGWADLADPGVGEPNEAPKAADGLEPVGRAGVGVLLCAGAGESGRQLEECERRAVRVVVSRLGARVPGRQAGGVTVGRARWRCWLLHRCWRLRAPAPWSGSPITPRQLPALVPASAFVGARILSEEANAAPTAARCLSAR